MPRHMDAKEQAQDWVERTCAAQGLPVKVTDRTTLDRVAVLLRETTPAPRPGIVVVGEPAGPLVWVRFDLDNNWIPDSSLDREAQVVSADEDWHDDDLNEVEFVDDHSRQVVETWRLYKEDPGD